MTSVPETATPIAAAPEASVEPPVGPRKITAEEIAEHADEASAWMSIHGKVYDLTTFSSDHPGGVETLLDKAGQDATDDFEDIGHSDQARKMLERYIIGDLEGLPGKTPKDESNGGGGGTMVNLALFGALTAAVTVYLGVSLEMIKLGFA